MNINTKYKLTDPKRFFLEPSNSAQRQYEALRAFFVEGIPSAEAAKRFGYAPGSFRVLVHDFRHDPDPKTQNPMIGYIPYSVHLSVAGTCFVKKKRGFSSMHPDDSGIGHPKPTCCMWMFGDGDFPLPTMPEAFLIIPAALLLECSKSIALEHLVTIRKNLTNNQFDHGLRETVSNLKNVLFFAEGR